MKRHRSPLARSMLSDKALREVEEMMALRREAIQILNGVVAEWDSDPTSVQCFDLRVVDRAKFVCARLKQLDVFG